MKSILANLQISVFESGDPGSVGTLWGGCWNNSADAEAGEEKNGSDWSVFTGCRTMKTTFALTLVDSGKKRACLYLNLEACSGFEYLLERLRSDTWRSAVLSAAGIGTADYEDGSMVQSVANWTICRLVLSMEDIQSTTAQEWIRLSAADH